MKSVLISIKPKYCELIANGKKTVEVRKTKPKIDVPFKCYIYCTKAKDYFSIGGGIYVANDELYRLPTGEIKFGDSFELEGNWRGQYNETNYLNGKVIGEFVCDRIDEIGKRGIYNNFDYCYLSLNEWGNDDIEIEITDIKKSCISKEELNLYGANSFCLYAWHITDLVIYEKPKELWKFHLPCNHKNDCCTCKHWDYFLDFSDGHCNRTETDLTRPPMSWCYIEKLEV